MMKIVEVEAIPIRASMQAGDVYWGNQSWGREKPKQADAPGLPTSDDRSIYPPTWRSRAAYSPTVDTTIVKITTDSGIIGWGESKSPVAPTITATIIRDLAANLLIGQDPTNPVLQWDRLYGSMRIRGHSHGFWMDSISGIDIALWDISAQALGVPLYVLLGGQFRDRVKVYASGIPGVAAGAPEAAYDKLRETAEDVRSRGFLGTKMGIGLGVEADAKSVSIVREVLGDDFMIFVDAAGMYDLPQALELGRSLEKLNVGWFEAPLPPEDFEKNAVICRTLDVPIANDQIFNRWQVRDMLLAGGIDVVQPDVCRTGGITECKRIFELADAFGKACTPHVSIGSSIQFAASVHLAAAMPNQTWMEFWYGRNPIGNAILNAPLRIENSFFHVPQGPGLGIDINEDALRQYQVQF
ncbi:MAG: mandelate racemase/muconate lactonizing enzyme family protein [Burkholderiales bacterium]|nr:mandelate racemase/muconate lactonizing enzyme family protein [Anaerolineae bacterium]